MQKLALFMLMLLMTASAVDYVAINSMDGRDVLSGIFYANVQGLPVKFIPPNGDSGVFASKIGSGHSIMLIEGNVPVSSFVQSALEAKNNTVSVYKSTNGGTTNIDLAAKSGAKDFIIVDSAYSDSAISVLPYAAKTDSYVVMADRNNINQVKGAVEDAESVIVYGYVDSDVKSALASLNPTAIGKGEDKYADNVELVSRMMDEYGSNSFIMTDGAFIEEGMVKGDMPFLLTGSKLVPTVTYNFMKQETRIGGFKSVMLIGNDLVVPVYDAREQMEKEFEGEGLNKTFGIVVKFAQVIPSAGTGVLVLDTFPMPAYKPSLTVKEIVYNDQTGKVMVSVDNTGEGPAYYNLELRIKVDGSDLKVFGSNQTKLIERGEQLGTEYDLDLSTVSEGNVTALAVVKYGSAKSSLEEFASKEGPLTTISYVDRSDVTVQSSRYDPDKDSVLVTIKNNGNETAYVFSRVSLIMGGSPTNVTGAATRALDAGSLYVEEFPLQLTAEDLQANENVTVYIDYGARQGFLLNHDAYIVSLGSEADGLWMVLIIALLMLLVMAAAAAFLLMGRKKKKKG